MYARKEHKMYELTEHERKKLKEVRLTDTVELVAGTGESLGCYTVVGLDDDRVRIKCGWYSTVNGRKQSSPDSNERIRPLGPREEE